MALQVRVFHSQYPQQLQEIINDFLQKHPGIQIRHICQSESAYTTSLNQGTAYTSGIHRPAGINQLTISIWYDELAD